jgi:hypothetical protein
MMMNNVITQMPQIAQQIILLIAYWSAVNLR